MQSSATVFLAEQDLWMEKFPFMEMCARQKPLFPELRVDVKGLARNGKFKVFLTLERFEDVRYAFDKETQLWADSKKRKVLPFHDSKEMEHPSGIQNGAFWMSKVVDFKKIKISSNKDDEDLENVFYVQTMHKYRPVIWILNVETNEKMRFVLGFAQFIPVTDYLHKAMGPWKASHNKYTTKRHGGQGKKRGASKEEEDGPSKKKLALMENNQSYQSESPPMTSISNRVFSAPLTFDPLVVYPRMEFPLQNGLYDYNPIPMDPNFQYYPCVPPTTFHPSIVNPFQYPLNPSLYFPPINFENVPPFLYHF